MLLHRAFVGLEEMLPVNRRRQRASSSMNGHSGLSVVLRRSVSTESMASPSQCDMCIVEKLLTNTEDAKRLSSWTRISWSQGDTGGLGVSEHGMASRVWKLLPLWSEGVICLFIFLVALGLCCCL